MTETIFEKIGGEKSVNLAVDIFYRRVLSDPKVATFFESTNMDDQRAKQKSFLTMVFGGPNAYTGKDLRTAHKPLVDRGLNDTHFNIVIERLEGTLKELGVPDDLTKQVIAIAETTRNDVLCLDKS
jgi:hemoglobin